MDIPSTWQNYADTVRLRHPGRMLGGSIGSAKRTPSLALPTGKALLIGEAGASGLAAFRRPANVSGSGLDRRQGSGGV